MAKNKVLICDYSSTMRSIFQTVLSTENYELTFYDNSYDALKQIQSEMFCIILCSVTIQPFDGYQFCRLIKSIPSPTIPKVILYYTDGSNVHSFWADKSGTDLFYKLDPAHPEKIIDEIKQQLEFCDGPGEIKKNEVDDKDLALLTADSIEKEYFNYIILDSIFELSPYINNIDEFVEHVILLITGICDADFFALEICNDSVVYDYHALVNSSIKNEINDFLRVTKKDFEEYASQTRDYQYISKEVQLTKLDDKINKGDKIQSYESFVIYANDFVGTLHVASVKNLFFSDRMYKRLLYFCEKIGILIEMSLNYQNITGKEKRMRKLFSRFVPEEIIDNLLKGENTKTEFIGEKRRVAVLISDIRDFTTISEVNTPENVVTFLNQYFSIMVDIIKKHGGSIDKFMGDAIMALFGATVSYEDNALRAVTVALEMCNAVSKLDLSLLKIPEGHTFNIGVGIHYGDVVVGSIGCTDKTDYTVIGDSVNLASRLEGLTKQYGVRIIISNAVKQDLGKDFFLRHLDNVKVKGKSIAVSIYSVENDHTIFSDKYLEYYNKAMELYILGGWNLASEYFRKALEVCPDDRAAELLLERCENFIKEPPKNWDGALALTSK